MDISQILGSTPTPQKGSTPNQPTNSVDGAFGQLIIKAKHSLEDHPSDQLPEGVSIPTNLDDLEAYLKDFVKNEMNPESLKKASANKFEFAELEEFVTNSELASNPIMGALTNEEIAEKISQMIQSGKISEEVPTKNTAAPQIASTEIPDLSSDVEVPKEMKAQLSISDIQKNFRVIDTNNASGSQTTEKAPEPVNFAANLTGKSETVVGETLAEVSKPSKPIVQDLNGGRIQSQSELPRASVDTVKQSSELTQQVSSVAPTALSQAIKDTVKPQASSESPNTANLADKIEVASQEIAKPQVSQTAANMTQSAPTTQSPVIIPTSGEGVITPTVSNPSVQSIPTPQTTTITSSMMIQNSIVATDEWKQELGNNMVRMAKTGDTTATLKLNPMELGTINVDLKVSDKQVQINFASMSSQVRAAVEQALPQLRESFEDQGLELSDSSFSEQSLFQQEQSAQRMVMNDSSNASENEDLLSEDTEKAENKVKDSAIDTYV